MKIFDPPISVRFLIIFFLSQAYYNIGVHSNVMRDIYERWFSQQEELNITEVAMECNKTFPIDANVAQYFSDNGQLPNEDIMDHKCFYRCLFEGGGWISLESGRYNMQLVAKHFSGVRGNMTMTTDIVGDMAHRCNDLSDHPDMCEKIYMYAKCIIQEELKYYGPGAYVETDF